MFTYEITTAYMQIEIKAESPEAAILIFIEDFPEEEIIEVLQVLL